MRGWRLWGCGVLLAVIVVVGGACSTGAPPTRAELVAGIQEAGSDDPTMAPVDDEMATCVADAALDHLDRFDLERMAQGGRPEIDESDSEFITEYVTCIGGPAALGFGPM